MIRAGVAMGLGVAVLNGVLAWVALQWALRRSGMGFVHVFLGGLVVRFLFVGAAALLILGYTTVHRAAFAASLMGGYLAALAVEVFYADLRLRRTQARGRAATGTPGQPEAAEGSGTSG